MRDLLTFEEYLEKGTVKKQKQNYSRAEFLIKSSEKAFIGFNRRIKAEKIDEYNANSIIKECHDIILELVRAKMLLEGLNASGSFAHEAEVSYLKELGFLEKDVFFMNELRYFRNGILYYGSILDADYARKVVDFMVYMRKKLLEMIK